MKNMDETYCINIRNTLVFREGTVRVDADGNLLSLAVLSEGFYCALLNKLMGWNLINANSEKQNASGIDLIDREKKIAVQVSLTCDHKKVQHSIDKFKIDSYDGWHFYFVPLKMDSPNFRKDFTLPEGVIFNEKEDVLSISRIMRIIEQEADIDKQREISVLMDKYTKESDPRSNKDTIELVEQRKQHVEQNTEEERSTREGKKATELEGSKNPSTTEKPSALDSLTNSASKPTLFLSYCSKDECIADLIENTLNTETNNGIIVSRDTRVPYRRSFKDFMKSIPKHDYVLCVVSDSYLKSQACMYEVGEIVKSKTYKQKLLFIVLNEADRKYYSKDYDGEVGATDIYGGAIKKLEYTEYWKEKYYELEGKIDSLDDKEATASAIAELKEIKQIYRKDINVFLTFLAEYNGKSFEELYSNRFTDIINIILPNWDPHIDDKMVMYRENKTTAQTSLSFNLPASIHKLTEKEKQGIHSSETSKDISKNQLKASMVTAVATVFSAIAIIIGMFLFGTDKAKSSGINQSASSFPDGSDIVSLENNDEPMFGIIGYQATKSFVAGWFDTDGGRPGYTIDEVNAGALGDTVTLNSIIDGPIGHEFNFVAAVDGAFLRSKHMWQSDTLDAVDGYAYQVRLYFENSSWSTSAEGVAVRFDICDTVWIAEDDDNSPEETTENNGYYLSAVHGYIIGSNTTPEIIGDSVCFVSERPFHLEYKYGTAVLENQGIGSGLGYSLSDDIVNDWTTIGYDKIDGVIPAGYQYDGVCKITVVPVFDQEPVSKYDTLLVRKEGTGDWGKSIEVNKGDIVEFQYHFINYETLMWNHISINSVLPDDIAYVKGSTIVFDADSPNGVNDETDNIISESGLDISNQKPIKEAYVRFQAVVGDISDKSDVYVQSRMTGELISDSVVIMPSA